MRKPVGNADSPPSQARSPATRLVVALTIWPILCGAVGNVVVIVASGRGGRQWVDAWPIAFHLGAVAMSPAAAITTAVGFRLARSARHWLSFLILPVAAPLLALGGIVLHYFLLGILGFALLFSQLPALLSAALVAALAVLTALALAKGAT